MRMPVQTPQQAIPHQTWCPGNRRPRHKVFPVRPTDYSRRRGSAFGVATLAVLVAGSGSGCGPTSGEDDLGLAAGVVDGSYDFAAEAQEELAQTTERGRFSQLWLQPDFEGGAWSQAHLEFDGFASAQNWPQTAKRIHSVQLFYGLLSKAYDGLPVAADRSSFAYGRGCVRKRPVALPDGGTTSGVSDADFAKFKAFIDVAKSHGATFSVESMGLTMPTWIAARPRLPDGGLALQPDGGVTPSILEGFARKGIGVGEYTATLENHVLRCAETDLGIKFSRVTVDNPLFGRSFVDGQFDHEVVPRHDLNSLLAELASYMQHMVYSDQRARGGVELKRPGVRFLLTEFNFGIQGETRWFGLGAADLQKYETMFGTPEHFELGSTLDRLKAQVAARNARQSDPLRRVTFDGFFLDSGYRHERSARYFAGKNTPLANPAKPFERLLAATAAIRARGLRVGFYLGLLDDDSSRCRQMQNAGVPWRTCAQVLRTLTRCAPSTPPTESVSCAPQPYTSEGETFDELLAADGRRYASMAESEVMRSTSQQAGQFAAAYLKGFIENGGRADYINFATWHPVAEWAGNEGAPYSWLWQANEVGRLVVPQTHPSFTGPLSNLYRIPGSVLLIERGRPDTTCQFLNFEQYRRWLKDHGIAEFPKLPLLTNPPVDLPFTGKCVYP